MNPFRAFIHTISPITDKTWEHILPLLTAGSMKKGEYFIEEGQICHQIAFLESGVIRAFYRNTAGVEYNKHFFTAPTVIGGFSSLITGKVNVINQQALTECHIWTADYARFCRLYNQFPDLERVGRRLAEFYFVDKEQREINIVLLDAEKRYQIFLQQYPGLSQLIPQYHIASYLGVTPTQLSRIRRKLRGK
jgi:CRP-like cAMP-binding protein